MASPRMDKLWHVNITSSRLLCFHGWPSAYDSNLCLRMALNKIGRASRSDEACESGHDVSLSPWAGSVRDAARGPSRGVLVPCCPDWETVVVGRLDAQRVSSQPRIWSLNFAWPRCLANHP